MTKNNEVYGISLEVPGTLVQMLKYTLVVVVVVSYDPLTCTGIDKRKNEAYSISSELQEKFEMSQSICYAALEPQDLRTTDNISYGSLPERI